MLCSGWSYGCSLKIRRKENLAKKITVEYEDGTIREVSKGIASEFSGETLHMDMVDISQIDLVRFAYGILTMIGELGLQELLEAYASSGCESDEEEDVFNEGDE